MNLFDIFRSTFGLHRPTTPQRDDRNVDVPDYAPRDPFFGSPFFFWGQGRRPNVFLDDDEDECPDDSPEGVFGFPNGQDNEEKDEGVFTLPFGGNDNFQFSVQIKEPDEMRRHFDEMFQSFNEMFRSMGIADFRMPGTPNSPGIGPPSSEPGSLRDKMLKEPDAFDHQGQKPSQPPPDFFDGYWDAPKWKAPQMHDKIDRDLDEAMRTGHLDSILAHAPTAKSHQMDAFPHAGPSGNFKSVSVRTLRGADGRVEERKTVHDGEGNKFETVNRSMADQTISVATKTDKKGTQEITERLYNMDEKDKEEFNRWWKSPNIEKHLRGTGLDIKRYHDEDSNKLFYRLFGDGFPGFGKSS